MALIQDIPCRPADPIALIITMPGVRKSMYEPPWKPGMSTTRLKRAPKSSSQIIGWRSVIATNHGWRQSASS
jgi:hypothetical protein